MHQISSRLSIYDIWTDAGYQIPTTVVIIFITAARIILLVENVNMLLIIVKSNTACPVPLLFQTQNFFKWMKKAGYPLSSQTEYPNRVPVLPSNNTDNNWQEK